MDHLMKILGDLIGIVVQSVMQRGFPGRLRPGHLKRKKTKGEGGQ